ncbi:hypothetical protein COLO4_14606 [Corchorus olitorius]|uniref:F-box domain-containing protein n=1 Tax=Corchorus olitorius TaxID=93759 RepID=A0A1R3JRV4_9ROSI|nr:hypothetical protein COLO4_14606 [Corchorus olitorius]
MIPKELIFEIFLCLSVKDLLRFRCLSKEFCQEIDSAAFTTAHLNRSKKTKTHRKLVVLDKSVGAKSGLYVADFDGNSRASKIILAHNPFGRFFRDGFRVCGSCNGLLLLFKYDDTRKEEVYSWLLLNPFTRKFNKVIACPGKSETLYYYRALFGFGYDSIGNEYKLVHIIRRPNNYWEDQEDVEIWVFSFATNTWREQIVPFCCNKNFPRKEIGVFADGDGALHWLSEGIDDDDEERTTHEIVTFDLSNEVFVNLIHSDSLKSNSRNLQLLVIGGSLALLQEINFHQYELYLAVKYVWTKLYNIYLYPCCPYCIETALEVSKNGDKLLLLMGDGKLHWYNLKKNTRIDFNALRGARHDFDGLFCWDTTLCWESLVWPATHSSLM